MGKRALLLQNVLELILQKISVDRALYNVWSRPVVCVKGAGRMRGSELPLVVINLDKCCTFGRKRMKEKKSRGGGQEQKQR